MNTRVPFITMQQAIDNGIIEMIDGRLRRIKGFHYRRFGLLGVDAAINQYVPNRKFFYKSDLASDEIRNRWIGERICIGQVGFTYIPANPLEEIRN